MHVKGYSRLNHIEGEAISQDKPNFQIWDSDDLRIITRLWVSMTTEISKNYMFYSSARQIWEDLANTYSMLQDISTYQHVDNIVLPPLLTYQRWANITPSSLPEDTHDSNPPPPDSHTMDPSSSSPSSNFDNTWSIALRKAIRSTRNPYLVYNF